MTKFDKFNLSSFEGVAKWPNKRQDSAWQGCLRKCGEACQLFNSSPRDTPPHLPPLPHTTSLTIRLLLLLSACALTLHTLEIGPSLTMRLLPLCFVTPPQGGPPTLPLPSSLPRFLLSLSCKHRHLEFVQDLFVSYGEKHLIPRMGT